MWWSYPTSLRNIGGSIQMSARSWNIHEVCLWFLPPQVKAGKSSYDLNNAGATSNQNKQTNKQTNKQSVYIKNIKWCGIILDNDSLNWDLYIWIILLVNNFNFNKSMAHVFKSVIYVSKDTYVIVILKGRQSPVSYI